MARALGFGLVALAAWGLTAACPARAADFVGSASCEACHAKAYELWQEGPHAHAARSLTAAQRGQPSCTHCHAPELAAAEETAKAEARVARRSSAGESDGIGCESCHGPGDYYSPAYVMRDAELARAVGLRDPGERSCKGCHTAVSPGLSPFTFAAKVKLIDHWSSERRQEKGAAHAAPSAPGQGAEAAAPALRQKVARRSAPKDRAGGSP